MLKSAVDSVQYTSSDILVSVKNSPWKSLLLLLVLLILLWFSAFTYGMFHSTLMQVAAVSKPVHFKFGYCSSGAIDCPFPTSNVSLQSHELMMRSQKYRIQLQLEVPESIINEKIGMFMVTIRLYNTDLRIIATASRTAILRFRSPLLQNLHTLVFSAFLLSGLEEQKQTLDVELISEYTDDPFNPCVGMYVELHSKKIQFYGARLNIQAHYFGLRYIMLHWPILSSFVGISVNMVALVVALLHLWRNYCTGHLATVDDTKEDDIIQAAKPNNSGKPVPSQQDLNGLNNGNGRDTMIPSSTATVLCTYTHEQLPHEDSPTENVEFDEQMDYPDNSHVYKLHPSQIEHGVKRRNLPSDV